LPVTTAFVASPTTTENIPCALVTTVLVSIYSGVASTFLLIIDNLKLIFELAIIVPFAERATPYKLIPWENALVVKMLNTSNKKNLLILFII
jgi:hypothetical protein